MNFPHRDYKPGHSYGKERRRFPVIRILLALALVALLARLAIVLGIPHLPSAVTTEAPGKDTAAAKIAPPVSRCDEGEEKAGLLWYTVTVPVTQDTSSCPPLPSALPGRALLSWASGQEGAGSIRIGYRHGSTGAEPLVAELISGQRQQPWQLGWHAQWGVGGTWIDLATGCSWLQPCPSLPFALDSEHVYQAVSPLPGVAALVTVDSSGHHRLRIRHGDGVESQFLLARECPLHAGERVRQGLWLGPLVMPVPGASVIVWRDGVRLNPLSWVQESHPLDSSAIATFQQFLAGR